MTNVVTIKQKESNRHVLPYTESKNSNKAYVALKSEHETMARDLEEAKKAEAAGKAAAKQVASLEEELQRLMQELEDER